MTSLHPGFVRTALLPAAFAALAAVADGRDEPAAGTTLDIEQGAISGKTFGELRAWLGVPYARPPVGELRWKPPLPPDPWQGVRECDEYGPSCPQPRSALGLIGGGSGEQSEDCLTLNVWAPPVTDGAKLPVMVWIHGGGFYLGAGSGLSYHGASLAAKGVVLVTINYRLGPFGFLAHRLLAEESEHGASGNYGLLDQIEALRWVRRNVAAFGGDPGNVTIFGESAGAFSVGCLLVSPLAKGLFHRAIAQSGAAIWIRQHASEPGGRDGPAEEIGEAVLAELVGDAEDVLAAARAKSPEEVLKVAQPSLRIGGVGGGNTFAPVIDGWSVPDAPARLFAEGAVNAVPFLCGTNSDEGAMFALQAPISTHDRLVQTARFLYGELVDEVLALYPTERYGDLRGVYSAILADSTFVAPTRAQARALTAAGAPCFVYHFTRVAAGSPASLAGAGRAQGGAWHAAEIGYVFGNLADGPLGRFDARDRALSSTMMDCWVQFARTGDPNGEGLPEWPKYSPKDDRHLELGDEISIASGLRAAECDLWEKVAAAAASGG